MIAPVIHQTWKDHDPPEERFPRAWQESWKGVPGFEHRLWSDGEILEFVADCYPELLPLFIGYDVDIKRVDAFRYMVLHHFGGVYADLDFLLLGDLSALLAGREYYLARQDASLVCNAFMAFPPRHPILSRAIDMLPSRRALHVLKATGPEFLTEVVMGLGLGEEVDPPDRVFPFPWNHKDKESFAEMGADELRRRFPEAVAVTFWTKTW